MDYDRIFASAPANVTAARAVSQGGEHYTPDVNVGTKRHFENPPPMVPVEDIVGDIGKRHAMDLIGRRFGRFTVMGLAAGTNPKAKACWVVRCQCGSYEHRKSKAIRNPNNAQDMCVKCQHWENTKNAYERLGSRGVSDFISQAESEAVDG